MARPLRIEFLNACYYVSSQGKNNRTLFPSEQYKESFLSILQDLHNRFNIDVHAYCLLRNEYHLLLTTRDAKLSRAMRYLNGVYTQRYNSTRLSEGALFPGRYRATVIDPDKYLNRVAYYLHYLPRYSGTEVNIEQYPWSSIAYYQSKKEAPHWLRMIAGMVATESTTTNQSYTHSMLFCTDLEVRQFFEKKKRPPVLGNTEFQESVRQKIIGTQKETEDKGMRNYFVKPNIEVIVEEVAREYDVDTYVLYSTQDNKREKKAILARNVAMTLSQDIGGHTLKDIASEFGIKNHRSVSILVGRLKNQINDFSALRNKYVELRIRLLSRC